MNFTLNADARMNEDGGEIDAIQAQIRGWGRRSILYAIESVAAPSCPSAKNPEPIC